jgi:predicted Zn-dependent protease
MRRSIILAAALAALWVPAVVAEGLPDLGEVSQAEFSPQIEKRVGESIMQDIRLKEPSYLDDPEIEAYLNRLGRRLASNSEGARQEFEFFALRDPTLNAFALPGGFIGVHTGLILAAQSESELAGVLSHEISHVTQHHIARGVSQQSQSYATTLLSLAVAILAGRHNADVAQGALIAGQAAGVQQQLGYSRDFEREADRVGLQVLERSGYDIRGMAAFFERLQRESRLYENNAPAYLRTHPLTTERIADIENRIQGRPYKQVPDSLDFLLVRAKLRSQNGTPQDAITDFQSRLKDRKYSSEAAARYGLTEAQLRAKDYASAESQVAELRRLKVASPMVDTLAAELRMKQNDAATATRLLRDAAGRYPQERAVAYALVDDLLASGDAEQALKTTVADLQSYPSDYRMHALQAKTYAMLGKRLQQHRAQGESYALQGQLMPAIEQFELAQKSTDGDFYEHSEVDARLRALKRQQAEEMKRKKEQGSGF